MMCDTIEPYVNVTINVQYIDLLSSYAFHISHQIQPHVKVVFCGCLNICFCPLHSDPYTKISLYDPVNGELTSLQTKTIKKVGDTSIQNRSSYSDWWANYNPLSLRPARRCIQSGMKSSTSE